ncbi:MAG: DUF4440 domain-containing protein [Acidobacteria bacterium]|nr:MAG: DUF4440 domain-containing protein [Acidobacteriota bacterium]
MPALSRRTVLLIPALGAVHAQNTPTESAVRAVLEMQRTAWNRGDVETFMAGYEASEETTFVGATVTRGYQKVLDNYHRRYPTKEKMGQLTFSDMQIRPLGADYASVIGRWHLGRPADAGGNTGGIYTLLFRKTAQGWKIILDHTS